MFGQLQTPATVAGHDLYFVKIQASRHDTASQSFANIANDVGERFGVNEQSNKSLNVVLTGSSLGSYRIGLWSYCREETSLGADGTSNCAPPSRDFWFNPLDVWTLEDPSLQKTLADDLSPGLKAYSRAVVFIKAAFILATVLTVAELFAIFFAIVTRAASAVGLVLSLASLVFTLAAAASTTIAYGALTGLVKSGLGPYNIEASIGGKMLIVVWLGFGLKVVSIPLWLPSMLCCKA
ncbi:hypothetical protein E8E12_001329 [Didymella heteroderae]|uniref:Integral membrane protein n=1 Tax=Didymella heteroderae TaxID=1769908 RepID=A0A9P4WGH2_9PLEO|nr:hypothetical protein E8E12_001329 [Didymella heteroderae]